MARYEALVTSSFQHLLNSLLRISTLFLRTILEQHGRNDMSGANENDSSQTSVLVRRRTRGRGLRTRTGCQACRLRRVKCDEARPTCSGCKKRGRRCEYLNGVSRPPDFPATDPPPNDELHSPRQEQEQPQQRQLEDELAADSSICPSVHETVGNSGNIDMQTEQQHVFGHSAPQFDPYAASPDSALSWSPSFHYSPDDAPLLWLGLLTNDANRALLSPAFLPSSAPEPSAVPAPISKVIPPTPTNSSTSYVAEYNELSASGKPKDPVKLSRGETVLFQHFVDCLSPWIDITDPDGSFSTVVAHDALRDYGLMRAILALSARHISLRPPSLSPEAQIELASMDCVNLAVQYYHETLQYLQAAMQNSNYLRSDQLLATVLIISTFEMLDGSGRDWERHLKGVFWIQRSQLIHGESEGIKSCIWWAWLRQDIWAAFKNRRRILSFYKLTRPCSSLGFWELVNRGVFLLGQCINYASDKDIDAGKSNLQERLAEGQELWSSLEEWATCFSQHDRRLPTLPAHDDFPFKPIWIQPPAAGEFSALRSTLYQY